MKRLFKTALLLAATIYGLQLFFDTCHYLGTRSVHAMSR